MNSMQPVSCKRSNCLSLAQYWLVYMDDASRFISIFFLLLFFGVKQAFSKNQTVNVNEIWNTDMVRNSHVQRHITSVLFIDRANRKSTMGVKSDSGRQIRRFSTFVIATPGQAMLKCSKPSPIIPLHHICKAIPVLSPVLCYTLSIRKSVIYSSYLCTCRPWRRSRWTVRLEEQCASSWWIAAYREERSARTASPHCRHDALGQCLVCCLHTPTVTFTLSEIIFVVVNELTLTDILRTHAHVSFAINNEPPSVIHVHVLLL